MIQRDIHRSIFRPIRDRIFIKMFTFMHWYQIDASLVDRFAMIYKLSNDTRCEKTPITLNKSFTRLDLDERSLNFDIYWQYYFHHDTKLYFWSFNCDFCYVHENILAASLLRPSPIWPSFFLKFEPSFINQNDWHFKAIELQLKNINNWHDKWLLYLVSCSSVSIICGIHNI